MELDFFLSDLLYFPPLAIEVLNRNVIVAHEQNKKSISEALNILEHSTEQNFIKNTYYLLSKTDKEVPLSDTEKDLCAPWIKAAKEYRFYKKPSPLLLEDKRYEQLSWEGVVPYNINTEKLKQEAKPYINKLLKVEDWNPPVGTYDRLQKIPSSSTLFLLIKNKLKSLGILNIVQHLKNKPVDIVKVVLQYSKPTDKHWTHFLNDIKIINKTINWHVDPDNDVIKVLIYLNNVDENSGPFTYLKGSNRYKKNKLQDAFGRSFSVRANHCAFPAARTGIYKLANYLRKPYNFGRMLQDNTYPSNYLINNATKFTSDIGNLILFIPGEGIHAGGLCSSKDRIALQVLIK